MALVPISVAAGQSATLRASRCHGLLPPRPRLLPQSAALPTLVARRICRGRSTNGWHTALRPGPVFFKASDPIFAGLFDEGPTEAAYANTVLEGMSQQEQGAICQVWVRQTLQGIHPEWNILDAELGTCYNGSKRGAGQAPYDFLVNGRKVESKSSRLSWCSSRQRWLVRFWKVHFSLGKEKRAHFDDLYLVIASPSGLLLIKHDLHTGICLDGKRTQSFGHTVTICGSVNDTTWAEARHTIVQKLCQAGQCKLIAQASFDDDSLQQLLATERDCRPVGHAVYDGVPLSTLSAQKRGLQIQQMAIAVDQKSNPRSQILLLTKLTAGFCSASTAPADWIRDGVAVEVKSSKLMFKKPNQLWSCCFLGVKPNFFDELWLAIYCPWGVGFYKHSSPKSLRLSSQGVRTKDGGFQLQISGPSSCEDERRAFEVIEEKLMSKGFAPHATVEWK